MLNGLEFSPHFKFLLFLIELELQSKEGDDHGKNITYKPDDEENEHHSGVHKTNVEVLENYFQSDDYRDPCNRERE